MQLAKPRSRGRSSNRDAQRAVGDQCRKRKEMKSALFVWGGWPGHEPRQCVDLFAPFLWEQGYNVEISDTLDVYLDEAKMNALSLIVHIWTMCTITKEHEHEMLEAVNSDVDIDGKHVALS